MKNKDISFLREIEGKTLKEKIKNLKTTLKQLETVLKKTELDISYDRWDSGKLSTKKANPLCNCVEMTRTCGCCSDAPLIACPYYEEGNFRVYSKPDSFTIAEGLYGGGFRGFKGWKTELRVNNISETMSKKDKLFNAGSKIQTREKGSLLDKKAMAIKLTSPKSNYKRVLFTLEHEDIEALNEIVNKINNHTKRKTSKSELVRVGINMLKKKTSFEILCLLKGM
ncbi:MAG: hypothetical protein ABIB11_01985 [Candidatus Omnitrophota bacterium]